MARIDNLENFLTDVATSIKAKKGITENIPAANFDSEIASIDTVKAQEKTVSPSTTSKTVTPDEMYNALSSVTVEAVTSDIDSNIIAENIKQGVSILGVEGNLEAGNDTSDATATANDILEGTTAYIADGKVEGAIRRIEEPLDDTPIATETFVGQGVSGYSLPTGGSACLRHKLMIVLSGGPHIYNANTGKLVKFESDAIGRAIFSEKDTDDGCVVLCWATYYAMQALKYNPKTDTIVTYGTRYTVKNYKTRDDTAPNRPFCSISVCRRRFICFES